VWGAYIDEAMHVMTGAGASAVRYYPHQNHLYSVAAVTDQAGVVVERCTYDAYGKQTITAQAGGVVRAKSAVGWDRGFTGYHLDQETGLYYARARMYSPTLGQFVSRDPYTKIFGWHYSGFSSYQTAVTAVVNFNNTAGLDYWDSYSLYASQMGLRQWIDPSGMQAGPATGGAGQGGTPPPCAGNPDPNTNWGRGPSSKGNCWRYACDKPAGPGEPHSPYPGPFPGGGQDPGGILTCAQVMAASKAGGAVDPDASGKCPCDYWKIAVVVSDPAGRNWNDYHYYRQSSDGSWSQKSGNTAATGTDASGAKIGDPSTADRDYSKNKPPGENYNQFCGYLCVKH
jgi:RHS repeat-associated protein